MKTNRIISVLIAASLVVGLFGALPTVAARAQDADLPIDPAFLQYALEHPDDYFAVIVQKAPNNGNYGEPEQGV
jgi:multisubunit Na+/H+ antiporter MnhE subunit